MKGNIMNNYFVCDLESRDMSYYLDFCTRRIKNKNILNIFVKSTVESNNHQILGIKRDKNSTGGNVRCMNLRNRRSSVLFLIAHY